MNEVISDRAQLSDTLRKLWHNLDDVPLLFDPAVNASDAIALAQRLTQLIEEHEYLSHQFRLTYLELVAISPTEWAATFSQSTWSDAEWYETRNVNNHPHTARAATPQLAISRAAASLVDLFSNREDV